MTALKLITTEETQALFNFPPHIKFNFDWPNQDIERTQLEENLFVEYYYMMFRSSFYKFSSMVYHRHNPYGPALLYRDGSYVYSVKDKRHRIGGPAFLDTAAKYMNLPMFYINGTFYEELEYWIAVENYLNDHPEE